MAKPGFLRSFWPMLVAASVPWAAPSAMPRALPPDAGSAKVFLHGDWALQSSCKITATEAQLSAPGFTTRGWHQTTVPSTVLAALVADHTYPDPYVGDNLRSIPGASYPTGANFALLPMPDDSPFRCSWWYRTEFRLPEGYAGRFVSLHFDGIDQRANVWLNGKQIASVKDVDGAYRTYEFDVTPLLQRDEPNALAVQTIAQAPQDLGINWIDWSPMPPDKNMGLRREVYLESSGPVALRNPLVTTHFPSPGLDTADLTVATVLQNNEERPVTGKLTGEIEGARFEQDVSLAAHEKRTVRFTAAEFAQLRLSHPKLWWPAQMGEPALHTLHLQFAADGAISDEQAIRFGIREIASEIDANGNRLFRVNGKRLLIRGAGWAPDMLLREPPDRLRAELRYVRDLNLNTIRLEGKMESDDFYDLADEQGLLLLPGWACCDRWQDGEKWGPHDFHVATESLRSQILLLRSHPSMLAWLNGSDAGPPVNVEQAYLAVLKAEDWPNPVLFSAAGRPSVISGPTGVKMTGPYDYVPADFWLADAGLNGGAAGFNMETGPGPGIPPESSLRRMFSADHLKPGDPVWTSHAAMGKYSKLDHFDETMRETYGAPRDLGDYERKAQAMAYDSERAMFEAYSRNRYTATTGIIQWMLNNAWPSLFWHLYDYYLQPAGGYFGAKKALEAVHVQYSYDEQSVAVVNSTYADVSDLKVVATVYDAALRETFSRESTVNVDADGVARAMNIPAEALGENSAVHYLQLVTTSAGGQVVSNNFYWLASRKNIFDWHKASYRFTPVQTYEDLQALAELSTVRLTGSAVERVGDEGPAVEVKIQNQSAGLAFQIRLGIRRKGESAEVLPVTWTDNYFELMPGESREVTAQYLSAGALGRDAELLVSGWNVEPTVLEIAARR